MAKAILAPRGAFFGPLGPPIVSKVTLNAILGIINESGVLRNQNKKKKIIKIGPVLFELWRRPFWRPGGPFLTPKAPHCVLRV